MLHIVQQDYVDIERTDSKVHGRCPKHVTREMMIGRIMLGGDVTQIASHYVETERISIGNYWDSLPFSKSMILNSRLTCQRGG